MVKDYHIGINKPKAKFLQLLDAAPRVILSTKFGDGKTTFLKEIEADDNKPNKHGTINPKYYFVTLHPVNYVVQDNKDIFEIIKRDILVQLLKDSLVFEGTNWEQLLENISKKGWRNLLVFKDIFADVCEEIPYLKLPAKIINRLINKASDELTDIEKLSAANYISSFTSMKGSIAEDDAITELIYEGIKHVNNVLNRKTVLIIEDMDRLDPAHMFRILNILAAHIDNRNYDEKDNANKFGFQKVVLVMDYDVTEHIFHHFYGKEANYEGYMRKFSSEPPFRFSIKEIVKLDVIQKIASECNVDKKYIMKLATHQYANTLYKKIILEEDKKHSIRDLCSILEMQPQEYLVKSEYDKDDVFYNSDLAKLYVYLKKLYPKLSISYIIDFMDISDDPNIDHLLAPFEGYINPFKMNNLKNEYEIIIQKTTII